MPPQATPLRAFISAPSRPTAAWGPTTSLKAACPWRAAQAVWGGGEETGAPSARGGGGPGGLGGGGAGGGGAFFAPAGPNATVTADLTNLQTDQKTFRSD